MKKKNNKNNKTIKKQTKRKQAVTAYLLSLIVGCYLQEISGEQNIIMKADKGSSAQSKIPLATPSLISLEEASTCEKKKKSPQESIKYQTAHNLFPQANRAAAAC